MDIKKNEGINDLIKILGSILIIFIAVFVFTEIRNNDREYDYIGKNPEYQNTMTFSGDSKMSVTPDIAYLNMGLKTEKKSVSDAQKENAETISEFIAKLKNDFEVSDSDVQTANYTVHPQYDWRDGDQKLRGYEVSQNIQIKVRNLDNVSDIIGLAAEFELNQVNSLSFGVDNKDEFLEQVRAKAITEAKEKAKKVANDLGISLGRIINFSESSSNGSMREPYYNMNYAKEESMDMAGGSISSSVEIGSNEIVANVNITYEIN
jgi:uncharacterized protein YggE